MKISLPRSIFSLGSGTKAKDVSRGKFPKVEAPSGRLGRAELGPYAWEDQMPRWLFKQLEEGPRITMEQHISRRDGRLVKYEHVENETPGIVPVMAQLSALDDHVRTAYLCHPAVIHVGKTYKEGGFCGYRNIHMLVSYIMGAKAQGHGRFLGQRLPTILRLQEMIEEAWDRGINETGRMQTGGVYGTRKYIGTAEAQALFLHLGIETEVDVFSDMKDGPQAYEQLLATVEQYFREGLDDIAFRQQPTNNSGNKLRQSDLHPTSSPTVHKTLRAPIYLQQPGHSITIVGFERRKDGSGNLLVLDPMFRTSPGMERLVGRSHISTPRPEVMKPYRRGKRQLGRHRDFEILMLPAKAPSSHAWEL
ncbi:peptidase family C78-domain-containing protein [Lineolata rhizophorae]|uniref:Peptidase family C78-domain-containing protein n=1 Tax=Lineolata rhizophorae TaxID=578093 RepID=A0A6A6P0K5_9PEZI|nr:peptidase family C78-domain-containing protein [Lineolata rhizophorae]